MSNQPEQSIKDSGDILKMLDAMIAYHMRQLEVGRPKASKYIPYPAVFHEFKQQQLRTIKRLQEIKVVWEKEND